MASCSGLGVVVWEWLADRGRWLPHEPRVSDYIETSYGYYRLANGSAPLSLGHADATLAGTFVDFKTMTQMSSSSVLQSLIRRNVYPLDSTAGRGIVWQWADDPPATPNVPGQTQTPLWRPYDLEITEILERANKAGQLFVDLAQLPGRSPYFVDLIHMTQVRQETGFSRRIQRIQSAWRYGHTVTMPVNVVNHQLATPAVVNISPACNCGSSSCGGRLAVGRVIGVGGRVGGGGGGGGGLCVLGRSSSSVMLQPGVMVAPQLSFVNGYVHPSASATSVATYFATVPPNVGFSSVVPPLQNAISQLVGGGTISIPTATGSSRNSSGTASQTVTTRSSSRLAKSAIPVPATGAGSTSGGTGSGSAASSGNYVAQLSKLGARTQGASISAKRLKTECDIVSSSEPLSNRGITNTDNLFNILHYYAKVVDSPPKDDDCLICQLNLNELSAYATEKNPDDTVIKLFHCGHMFHRTCLSEMYKNGVKDGSLQCPTCKRIYGTKFGNCPPGYMTETLLNHSLPSYEHCRTIRVTYAISPGIQGPEHPNPGKRFNARGFPRFGYLPDNTEGRMVLSLLRKAWERRLTFTIGTSVTTGEPDTVVWNEIHHKTEIHNHMGHGYPDPNYLTNVVSELAAQGVSQEN